MKLIELVNEDTKVTIPIPVDWVDDAGSNVVNVDVTIDDKHMELIKQVKNILSPDGSFNIYDQELISSLHKIEDALTKERISTKDAEDLHNDMTYQIRKKIKAVGRENDKKNKYRDRTKKPTIENIAFTIIKLLKV